MAKTEREKELVKMHLDKTVPGGWLVAFLAGGAVAVALANLFGVFQDRHIQSAVGVIVLGTASGILNVIRRIEAERRAREGWHVD